MRAAIVPADQLDVKDLRASRYAANPKLIATTAVQEWNLEFGGVIALHGPAGKRLIKRVEQAIREGMAKR
jgi:hypothetical protein